MKALVMTGPRQSKVVDVPDLTPGAGQLLVKVKYTGVCMSEWHPWAEARGGERMGHEPVGTVAALGEGVCGFAVGDRVTMLPHTSTCAEYCLASQDMTLRLPDNIRDEDALGEPLSCLVSVASKLRAQKAGDPVAMVGTGYMGLGLMTLLKLQGAGRIIAVDEREEARDNACRFGATDIFKPEDIPERYLVCEWNDGMYERGLPLVAEFAGTQSALWLASQMTGIHGTLGIAGFHQGGDRTVDLKLWGWKGITVINTHERRPAYQFECMKNALDMIARGIWNYTGVGSHIYGLDGFDQANRDMERKPKGFIKALVRCSD